METLGKRIRLLRHQKGWSQEDVAKRLEVSIPAFSKIETGITDVSLSRLEQISKLFDLSVVELLTFVDSDEQKKYNYQLEEANKQLQDREAEVIKLQKKIIELYEELRKEES
jgi:transcriptional regulator with XRE-family HTH domain